MAKWIGTMLQHLMISKTMNQNKSCLSFSMLDISYSGKKANTTNQSFIYYVEHIIIEHI